MSRNDESISEELLDEFFREADKDELRELVSLSDKTSEFGWNDIDHEEVDFGTKVWGKAIEYGIIRKSNDKYILNSRSQISQYLSDNWSMGSSSESDADDEEDTVDRSELPDLDYDKAKWNRKDKLAALMGGVSMLGFSFEPIRQVIFGTIGLPFTFLLEFLPFFAVIFVIALVTSIWSVVVREMIHDISIDDFRENLSALRGDGSGFGMPDDATQEEEEEMMRIQQSMMKAQFRPMGWIVCISIPLIVWIFTTSTIIGHGVILFPLIGEFVWSSTIIGPLRVWIFWYIICSIPMSVIVKNILAVNEDDDETED